MVKTISRALLVILLLASSKSFADADVLLDASCDIIINDISQNHGDLDNFTRNKVQFHELLISALINDCDHGKIKSALYTRMAREEFGKVSRALSK